EELAEPLTVELGAPRVLTATAEAPPHRARYAIALPFAHLPQARLVLSTPARVFERDVTLAFERPPVDPRSPPRTATIASVQWRHADPDLPAPELTVSVRHLNTSTVHLSMDEVDNSPLPLGQPRLLLPGYRLRFFRS